MAAGVSLHAQPPQLSKCQSCHGTDGNSSSASVPRLNGQQPQYFANRVRSSLTSPLYVAMETVFRQSAPNALVVPFLMRGTTDGAYLRAKGMAVYGVPLFRKDGELRLHGNDERMSIANLRSGTELLGKIVMEAAKP